MKIRSGFILTSITMLSLSGCNNTTHNTSIPDTMKDSITTEYFGTIVEDPYRWLEEKNTPRVKNWIGQQNDYADKILSAFPGSETT